MVGARGFKGLVLFWVVLVVPVLVLVLVAAAVVGEGWS